jgi:hypothetical protein
MFRIQYFRFLELWNRCWFVLGCEDSLRPYAMRVGAGARYEDSALGEVMQNHVLSNSSKVRQSSYQPRSISKNLLALSYGLIDQDTMLENTLRNSSANRDENAPLYLAPGDSENFETRFDLLSLREQYAEAKSQHGANDKRTKRVANEIGALKRSLSVQLIKQRRAEYFEAARMRRASGLPTDDLIQASVRPPKSRYAFSHPAAASICQFLTNNDLDGEQRRRSFPTLLQAFLSAQFSEVQAFVEELVNPTMSTHRLTDESKDGRLWRCILCPSATCFGRRYQLARHHLLVHMKNPGQFRCPECYREKGEIFMVSGPSSPWFNHAERIHGAHTAPYELGSLKATELKYERARCLLCDDGRQFSVSVHSRHFNKHHATTTNGTFNCPECARNGREDKITGQAEWSQHAREAHGCDKRGFPLGITKPKRRGRRLPQQLKDKGPSDKSCHACTDSRRRNRGNCVRPLNGGPCRDCESEGIQCMWRAGYGQACGPCAARKLICWLVPGKSSCLSCSKSQRVCEGGSSRVRNPKPKLSKVQPAISPLVTDSDCDMSEVDSAVDLNFDWMMGDWDALGNEESDFDPMRTSLSYQCELDKNLDSWTTDDTVVGFEECPIDPQLLAELLATPEEETCI